LEARFDRLDGVGRREELGDVGLGQVQRHVEILAETLTRRPRLRGAVLVMPGVPRSLFA
jgi:hypothetical protein